MFLVVEVKFLSTELQNWEIIDSIRNSTQSTHKPWFEEFSIWGLVGKSDLTLMLMHDEVARSIVFLPRISRN